MRIVGIRESRIAKVLVLLHIERLKSGMIYSKRLSISLAKMINVNRTAFLRQSSLRCLFGWRLLCAVIGAQLVSTTGVRSVGILSRCALLMTAGLSWSAASATPSQQAYLKASNTDPGDSFGGSVAVSGNTMVVGAPSECSNATGVNGNQNDNSAGSSGAAYVFVRSASGWSQEAYLKASNTGANDQFGTTLAVSGDTVVIGAPGESSQATGVNGNQSDNDAPYSGAAYVFVRSGTNWTQQAYLKASNTELLDLFGISVTVSGDTIVVGANRESSRATGVNGDESDNSAQYAGAAYVFVRSGTNWSQQAYLKASNTGGPGYFGGSVSVSRDTVVVGAGGEGSSATGVNGSQNDTNAPYAGAAYVFVRSGTNWTQQAYLKASNSGSNNYFGGAVSISGETVAIGANGEPSNATGVNGNQSDKSALNSGAAYVFVRRGTNWSQEAYLKASNTEAEDLFGLSISISGDIVAIGATGESSNATGVNGSQNDNTAPNAGAAYVFVRSGMNWTQQAYLKASNTGAGDFFGGSVAVSRDTVVAGASGEGGSATGVNGNQSNTNAPDSGAAYVFTGLGSGPQVSVVPDGTGGYFIRFDGAPDTPYRLQRAINVTGPWETIATLTGPPAGGLLEHHDMPLSQAFYRTVQP